MLLLVAVALWLAAVLPASAAASFGLITSWGGSGAGMFAPQVSGVATDAAGDVYVVDGQNTDRIEEFNAAGELIRKWGSKGEGDGEMTFPIGIAVAAGGEDAGDVYVADAGNRRVDEFTALGAFVRTWGWGVKDAKLEFEVCAAGCLKGQPHGEDEGGFETPVGVAVDATTGDVYVSDASGVPRWPIQKFSPAGAFIGKVGVDEFSHGPVGGAFSEPDALATDAVGDLYAVDGGNERIQELGPHEEFLRTWGRGVQNGELVFQVCTSKCTRGAQGEEAGAFEFIKAAPASIAIDPTGNVWVPDPGSFRVQEFGPEGSFLMAFGWGVLNGSETFQTCTAASTCRVGLKGATPPQFEDPLGAAAAPSGCGIYVTDAGANDLLDVFADPSTAACGVEPEKEKTKEKENTSTGGGSNGNTSTQTSSSISGNGTSAAAPSGIASTAQAIEELTLGCSGRRLVLNDVYIHGNRVAIAGSAAKGLIGRRVAILFNERQQVATAKVLPDGQYATTAPLPPAKIREALTTRYTAEIGGERSLHLKLTRRLLLEAPKASGTTVTLSGQVTLPLTKPIAPVVVEQQLECHRTTIVRRFTPPTSGRFRITITVPATARAGIFTLKSSVAANARSTSHGFTTYSLPLPVLLG